MKKFVWLGVLALLLVIIGPIVVTRLSKTPSRKLSGVKLEETRYREITFSNAEAGLELGGMLFVPDGAGPFPAAVIIHGSGSSKRNNRWYLTLTRSLQEKGIAVLLPDKRGSERSPGNWRTASFENLATDTLAAISFLKRQGTKGEIPVSKIGVIGLSQGGHIAPLVASKTADVAFVVDVVGSSLPMHELLVYEENNNFREMGILPGISNVLARASTIYLRRVGQREFWDAVGNFDPLPYWQMMTQPALVLYGAQDTNVPSRESADRLNALSRGNIKVVVFEGSGHALESPPGEGESIFREDALRRVADFIHTSP